jgi:uncharacterized membrane protein YdjX (TVP38/TMEM64 family)
MGVHCLLRRETWIIAALVAAVVTGSALFWISWEYGDIFSLAKLESLRAAAYAFLGTIPPLLYFAALVILPAAGAPLTVFYLTALPVLGSHSTAVGLSLVWLALLLNMVLAHLLSRGLFHPLITWAIRHRGLSIPQIQPTSEWQIVLAVRLSPIPFALQNYLLALGRARWSTYLWASLPIQAGIGTAVMLLGESILSGGLGFILVAVSLLLALQVIANRLRSRLTSPDRHARS